MLLLLLKFFILFSTVIFTVFSINYDDEDVWCVGRCYFKPGEVTRKRLAKWPKDCDNVCSILWINSNCDASYLELKEVFQDLKYFKGGIIIDGAKFENLSFFPENVEWDLESEHLIITNNMQLTNIYTVLNTCTTGKIQILNNPKLNVSDFCDSKWFDETITQVAGNLGNCACSGGTVNWTTIGRFKNCQYISGHLTITNVDDRSNVAALSKVRYISGDLEVTGTNLTTLTFFEKLERITTNIINYKYNKRESISFNIHDNPLLSRISIWELSSLNSYDRLKGNLESLSPEFCLTMDEVYLYLGWSVQFENLEARSCIEDRTDFGNKQLCYFNSMKKLGNNCSYISGDVLVDSGDEEYALKLKKVIAVFGSITVKNTSLTNCSFFGKLERVASLNKSVPIMQFIGNQDLQSCGFPRVNLFLSNGNNQVILNDNHPKFFKNNKSCLKFQEITETNVLVNGQPCVTYCQTEEPREDWCDGLCYFKPGEITLKRLGKWPSNCSDICTTLQINANCDISYSELKETFKNMRTYKGGIIIDGAKFENLSFFPENVKWELVTDELVITDNTQLNNIDTVLNMCTTTNFQILNNPKLNVSELCDSKCFDKKVSQISGNLGNCACSGGTVTSTTVGRFKNCQYISGSLIITDVNYNSNMAALSKIRYIAGDLEITRTNLTTLSFFKNFKEIGSRTFDYNSKPRKTTMINIHENYFLKKLELNSLYSIYSLNYREYFTMNLENLHHDFCLTIDEMHLFLMSKVRFENLDARFCEEKRSEFNNKKYCVFRNMKKLDFNCHSIFGNVLVDSGDEQYEKKLRKVEYVFGSITVQNTDLTDFAFLENLKVVMNLNKSQPVMQFLKNRDLQNFDIPLVEKFLTNGNNKVIVNSNHPNIFKDLKGCMIFQFKTQTNVSIDGQPCKSIPKTLPAGYGYDLDHMDYSEDSLDDWEYYSGVFYMIDEIYFPDLNDNLRKFNVITAITCLLINTFNLIILLQKKLRENFIYILMIGVSISDILMVATFILDYLLDAEWIYQFNLCKEYRYIHVLINTIDECVQVTTRRYSSFLALLMAFLRTLSVTFPLNTFLIRISKPKPVILISFILLAICSFYDGIQYLLNTRITPQEYCNDYKDLGYNSTYVGYWNSPDYLILDVSILNIIIDTTTTVITGFLYLLVTILLLYQLRIAHKRRNALRADNDKVDGTSKLITIMAVTFFVSEVLYGAYQLITTFYLRDMIKFTYFGYSLNYLFWTFLIINSNIHCLICFFMSSQYREVVRQLFWRKEKKAVTLVNMATISVAKSSSSRSTI